MAQIKELRIDLAPRLTKLDVYSRRDILAQMMEGEWSTIFKGRGIEFAGFRVYQYGDDASLIDWKASLKSKETLIREFEEFKNFTVFFLFDVSDTMIFSSHEKLKCEYAAEFIYTMADSINKAGDSIGMAMFNDAFVNRIFPHIGSEVLSNMKANLLNKKNYGGKYDLKKALLMSRSLLGQRAVIIIVSDFIGLEPGWEKYVEMLSTEFEIIGVMVRDPRDREFPDTGGQFMLKDPYTEQNIYIDVNKYAKKYKLIVEEQEKYIELVFRKTRGDFLKLITDQDYLPELVKFFNRRSRRQD